MKAQVKNTSDTNVHIVISADAKDLAPIKEATLNILAKDVSAPGFRKGKAPLNIVEQQVDDNYLKSQFLDNAMTALYSEVARDNRLRPIQQPKVEVKKFVAYSELEFELDVEVIPEIKLADYKNIKMQPETPKVTDKDVQDVIEQLKKRVAEKNEVERAAKDGDEAWIDFEGKDDNGQDVAGASGKDYPLLLGSNTFIKGFEPEIIGLKKDDEKEFTVTFPKDYGHKPLANKDVTFKIKVKKVNEVKLPEANDDFASKVGPFKTLAELKEDILKQLTAEKTNEAKNIFQDKLMMEIINGSKIDVPDSLIEEQIEALKADFKQNLVYRGITIEEYLKQSGLTEEEFIEKEIKPKAINRVKSGLILSEIAAEENLTVTPEELEIRIQLLKNQYQDEQMLAQLDAPEAQRDIANRLLTEKTLEKLIYYATN